MLFLRQRIMNTGMNTRNDLRERGENARITFSPFNLPLYRYPSYTAPFYFFYVTLG